MNETLFAVIEYLKYLNENADLNVTIHFNRAKLDCLTPLEFLNFLPYNCHNNPYCMKVKSCGYQEMCQKEQKYILKNPTQYNGIVRECYAGVCEYVRPVTKGGEALAFISVSGYRKKEPDCDSIIDTELWTSALKDEEIPIKLCETLITPLRIMLEKLFSSKAAETSSESNSLVQFLNDYYVNASFSDVCKYLKRSKTYVSNLFKNDFGMTFKEYCNNLKIEEAKNLLTSTEDSVTEIAFKLGYNDVSYFIELFKRYVGTSPLKYRNSEKQPALKGI